MNGAIAIFAKTPGLSPVKTRLASGVGTARAEEFYLLSVKAIEGVAGKVKEHLGADISIYWALAEENAVDHEFWQSFSTIWTGEGGLGDRLHNVYEALLAKHDYVIMIGSDSPQLQPAILLKACEEVKKMPEICIIGACNDGGFYLFASGVAIKKHIWLDVVYSKNSTLEELSNNLNKENISVDTDCLPPCGDVDVPEDLAALNKDLQGNIKNLLPAQHNILKWLNGALELA